MQQKEISPIESLSLISGMIDRAKNKLADDGFLLIFWGWLVFSTGIIHYLFLHFGLPKGQLAWTLMPLGGVISLIYGARKRKKERVRTYLDVYLRYSWGAFLVGLTISLVFMEFHGYKTTYFFIMVLYGMATFVSGGLLRFKPLVVGSLFSFAFAIVSVFADGKDILLCISAAILCSYIIPGHLLRAKFRSQ